MTAVLEPETLEAVPTQDAAAERAVLGAILLNPNVADDAHEVGLQGDDFHAPRHEVIWDTVERMLTAREAVDAVTVAASLQASGELGRIGGPAYLHTLISDVPAVGNVGYYAQIVVEHAGRRRLAAAGQRIRQFGSESAPVAELLSAASAEIDAVSERLHGRTSDDTSTAIDEALDQLQSGIPAFSTGLRDLDDVIRGWVPGTLTIIGARPRIGKSAFTLQTVLHCALNLGFPVGFTSLEMPRPELVQRAMSNLAKVDYGRMQKSPDQPLTTDEWDRLAVAAGKLREAPLHLSDRAWASVRTIEHDIRAFTRKVGRAPVMWVVDYLQLMTPAKGPKQENREQQVAAMSRALKLLAKRTGVAILALAQLNRGSEHRTDKRPGIADLRESGGLEQDADRVILLHRDLDPDGDASVLWALVEKNRQGRQGAVELDWLGHFQLVQGRKWSPSSAAAR